MSKIQEKTKKLTYSDIIRSKPRFQIYGLLHIYNELSLGDLSKRMGKAKSTIHQHLDKMIGSGFVEVTRTEKIRSDREKKYYSWVKQTKIFEPIRDSSESSEKEVDYTPNYSYDEESIKTRLESLKTFAEYNKNMIENWIEFLKELETIQIKEPLKVATILKDLDEEVGLFHSVAFYSTPNAKKIYNGLLELYSKIPDEDRSTSKENPYFGGLSLFPIRLILDTLYPADRKK